MPQCLESCDHCGRELTEDGCTAFGKVFHKECFRCHGCKKRLDGKFFSKDEHAYCAKCHKVIELQTKVIRRFPKISQSWRRPLLGPSPS